MASPDLTVGATGTGSGRQVAATCLLLLRGPFATSPKGLVVPHLQSCQLWRIGRWEIFSELECAAKNFRVWDVNTHDISSMCRTSLKPQKQQRTCIHCSADITEMKSVHVHIRFLPANQSKIRKSGNVLNKWEMEVHSVKSGELTALHFCLFLQGWGTSKKCGRT